MARWGIFARYWPLGLAYLAVSGVAILHTRFHHGVAMLWAASAILIAVLTRTRTAHWWAPIAMCGAANVVSTSLWGLGPAAALPMASANLGEAAVAAWLLKSSLRAGATMNSIGWFARFVAAVGVVGPLTGAALTAGWGALGVLSIAPKPIFAQFMVGHALGNLTFKPLAGLVATRRGWQRTAAALASGGLPVLGCLVLVAATAALVFGQQAQPLLFLPILPMILTAFCGGREAVALSLATVAVIGGTLTAVGRGPSALFASDVAERMLFFQFYLATTVLTLLPVAAELNQRRRLMRRVSTSELRFRMIAEQSSDIIAQLDRNGRITYISPAVRNLSGFAPESLIGQLPTVMIESDHHERVIAAHHLLMAEPDARQIFEWLGQTADGSQRWFESSARALVDNDGRVEGTMSVIRDISDRKILERQLVRAALTDSLTGLPNRRAFREEVDRLAPGDHCLALLDIDLFKAVNDRFGHDCGDEVLRVFARIAIQSVRRVDLVARLGGEEFALLLPDTALEDALVICERFRKALGETDILASGHALRITVSGGVAPVEAGAVDAALKLADLALYQAKAGGRDQLVLAA